MNLETLIGKAERLKEMESLLHSQEWKLVLKAIASRKASNTATALDLTQPNAVRDAATGAVKALEELETYFPTLRDSLAATVEKTKKVRRFNKRATPN
jgi:hypothetical protein